MKTNEFENVTISRAENGVMLHQGGPRDNYVTSNIQVFTTMSELNKYLSKLIEGK